MRERERERVPIRVLRQVLLINFHLLSPLRIGVALRRAASPSIAAYRCQVQRINQTNWERTGDDDDDDGDDDEWGMSWVLKYLKDTHDSKQLQCAARIIIYMCVRVCV